MKRFEVQISERVYSTWEYFAENEEDVYNLNGEFGEKVRDDFFDDVQVLEVKLMEGEV